MSFPEEAHSEVRDLKKYGGTRDSVNLVLMWTADSRGCIILGSAMRGPELLGKMKQQRELPFPPPNPWDLRTSILLKIPPSWAW